MKDKIFGVLQRVGRSFMLPIALLPVAGLFLGIGGSFTNVTMLTSYNLLGIMGPGTVIYAILTVMMAAGEIVFANLPIIFAMGVAIGMARQEKAVAALAGVIGYFIMHTVIGALISITGTYTQETLLSANETGLMEATKKGIEYIPIIANQLLPSGSITSTVGITSLQMGVFGGIIVGLGVAALHNRFYKIELPPVLSFFGGTRFVPIITAVVFLFVGGLMFFIWPFIQNGIYALGGLVMASGYFGTFIYGVIERALIPFGLHHVFYLPFWQTGLGGTMTVDGVVIEGAQNIFFAQLASPNVTHFSVEATRFMAGKFPFMIFGLPGAALAMYKCAKTNRQKEVGGLLISAALTAMITGITEPLEFTFLFVAPFLYVIHSFLAGLSFMLMHILNVGVGMTFSGGLIDLTLFGILQGNAKTNWVYVVVVGVAYFFVYYFLFKFLIKKFNLKTPGREDDDEETKLYTRTDVEAKKNKGLNEKSAQETSDPVSAQIISGLGGKNNIIDLDSCATRLRVTVADGKKIDEKILKVSGAIGVIKKGNGIQIIYGPTVTVIKSKLSEYLDSSESDLVTNIPSLDNPEEISKDESENDKKSEIKTPESLEIFTSPIDGEIASITETPDDAFSQKMVGDGIVIFPTGNKIYAPCDANIEVLFPTKHALGLTSLNGTEILIHIGIDTVKLEGKGFTEFIKQGDKVKKGDLLMQLDLDFISKNAPSTAIPVVFTNLSDNQKVTILKSGTVKANEEAFAIKSR
ncbi:PTS transporter subunit IIABC [Acetobacterium woodii]|uniref:Glucose-specific phosphotransferase system (PTS) IIABC components n=1 Tax=Acetobacterium woodii (strain ATCC 29683 / DSM 1030 / JCM 2381 / KCTC 1655 / WB1) TaxID=931626 RepID=H6LKQ3_ACEWD|nr:PTS transporter subunit IIABC [Acetobacterium woodii]AFA48845.1 glucose-specific phosphotransferase system (PTS) IIABC components [Acetobacterium woodii DSM 1030]